MEQKLLSCDFLPQQRWISDYSLCSYSGWARPERTSSKFLRTFLSSLQDDCFNAGLTLLSRENLDPRETRWQLRPLVRHYSALMMTHSCLWKTKRNCSNKIVPQAVSMRVATSISISAISGIKEWNKHVENVCTGLSILQRILMDNKKKKKKKGVAFSLF